MWSAADRSISASRGWDWTANAGTAEAVMAEIAVLDF